MAMNSMAPSMATNFATPCPVEGTLFRIGSFMGFSGDDILDSVHYHSESNTVRTLEKWTGYFKIFAKNPRIRGRLSHLFLAEFRLLWHGRSLLNGARTIGASLSCRNPCHAVK